jgi:hypothetical protein
MSRLTLPFADGEYQFHLGLAQINEVQKACNAGIGEIFARLCRGRFFKLTPSGEVAIGDPMQAEYRIEDLVNVIRQGLIGGGQGKVDGQSVVVDAQRAKELIDNYVLGEDAPLKDSWALAAAILQARIEGYDVPEAPAAKPKKKARVTAG